MITLLTDYGHADEFVGVLHGVIAGIAPQERVIDVSHAIPPCDIAAGGRVLARAIAYLPVGVHVAVVDPGVGGARRAVAVQAGDGRLFVGPDNGLLDPALRACGGAVAAADIGASPYRLEAVSATFHGRDIFAPVAAALAVGRTLEEVGEAFPVTDLVALPAPVLEVVEGRLRTEVIGADTFGNLVLAATARDGAACGLATGADVQLRLPSHELHVGRMVRTFSEGAPDELLVLADSAGMLSLAFSRGSAAARLSLSPGAVVELAPGDQPLS